MFLNNLNQVDNHMMRGESDEGEGATERCNVESNSSGEGTINNDGGIAI